VAGNGVGVAGEGCTADAAGADRAGQGIKLLIKPWWEITEAMRAHTAGWGLGERELAVRL
jgi:hypothetical protein